MSKRNISPYPDFKIKLISTEEQKRKDEDNGLKLPSINLYKSPSQENLQIQKPKYQKKVEFFEEYNDPQAKKINEKTIEEKVNEVLGQPSNTNRILKLEQQLNQKIAGSSRIQQNLNNPYKINPQWLESSKVLNRSSSSNIIKPQNYNNMLLYRRNLKDNYSSLRNLKNSHLQTIQQKSSKFDIDQNLIQDLVSKKIQEIKEDQIVKKENITNEQLPVPQLRNEINRLNQLNYHNNNLYRFNEKSYALQKINETKLNNLGQLMKNYYDFPPIKRASFLPPFIDNRGKDLQNQNQTIQSPSNNKSNQKFAGLESVKYNPYDQALQQNNLDSNQSKLSRNIDKINPNLVKTERRLIRKENENYFINQNDHHFTFGESLHYNSGIKEHKYLYGSEPLIEPDRGKRRYRYFN